MSSRRYWARSLLKGLALLPHTPQSSKEGIFHDEAPIKLLQLTACVKKRGLVRMPFGDFQLSES